MERKGELSLVGKYIRSRIKEIEINMQVREIKEPSHINNTSFEDHMRERLGRAKKRKIDPNSAENSEKDTLSLSSDFEAESEPVQEVKPPRKKMKCGCTTHEAEKPSKKAEIRANRRKSIN
ncbi:uncharacterized protein NEMAJ01_0722 [Nematocida major]|uniref:uncharacterized protein n=1 Tax=Nematocida major TaxID=1912982 RepID=UPI0020086D8B|nr:uncharacterized protein NEMAJ01_0722 [Nematocida major]KAH9385826.1 hypothetical protein NEMAJ01_0722 [Nematocida major]